MGHALGAEAAESVLAEALPDSAPGSYTADDVRFMQSVRQVVSTASSRIEAEARMRHLALMTS